MSEILITGATGFLGAALVRQLIDDVRYSPVATVRRKSSNLVSGLRPILVGDLGASTNWSSALSDVEVVIHTAARVHVMNDSANDPLTEYHKVNLEGTLNLARQAVQTGVKRFIFISSIKVNGEKTVLGKPFTADDVPNPVDPYGVSKAETEQALLELAASTGLEVVIIRPVLIYGPGVKANFGRLMQWVDRGVPLPLGLIRNKRSLVALDNLVDLIITCVEHPRAVNQVLLISDDEDLSTTELLQRVGEAFSKPARLIPIPAALISFIAKLMGKRDLSQRLLGSLQVDISKTRELLGWVPPVSVDEALQKTVQFFQLKK